MKIANKAVALFAGLALLTGARLSQASTVAYWRFEEGTAGTAVAPQPFQIPDSSGNGNTLQTFANGTNPTYTTDNPGNPINPPLTNHLAFDFSAVPSGTFATRDLYTGMTTGDINTHPFPQFTIEASVKFTGFGGFQTFVGKDGYQFPGSDDQNVSSFYLQSPDPGATGGVPVVAVATHQADGAFVRVNGTTVLQTGVWYNVVAVSDGTTLSLYLQSTPGGTYNLEGSAPFVGGMAIQNRTWTVGRGMYANNVTDRFYGSLDEVRISDSALLPAQFLFAPPVNNKPDAPANLTAVSGNAIVYLNWQASTGAASYNVKRSTTPGGPYTTIATGLINTQYTDTAVVNGVPYFYVVSASNTFGESPNSNQATGTPTAPFNGNGDGLQGTYYPGDNPDFSPENNTPFLYRIDPTINFNQDNANQNYSPRPFGGIVPHDHFTAVWTGQVVAPYTGSYVFRAITDDGVRLTVNGVTVMDTNYQGPTPTDTPPIALTAGQKADIKIEYFQGGGGLTAQLLYTVNGLPFEIIPQSQLLSGTASAVPQAPINLAATGNYKSISLIWGGAAGATSYNVKRSTTNGGPYTTIATGLTNPIYRDSNVTAGTTYYYVVSGVNATGEGPNSSQASATPFATFTPVAYWRFEGGTPDTHVPVDPFKVPDTTGHGNDLSTFLDDSAPTWRTNNPGNPINPPATNTLSMDFSEPAGPNFPVRELNTFNATGDINSHAFPQFTVEASVNFNSIGGFQTFVGKDGQNFPGDQNVASFYLNFPDPSATGGIPVFSVRTHQADGNFIVINGTTPIVAGQWYNVAAVADGTTLSLYVQSTPGGPYHLDASAVFIGGMAIQNAPWSVGRGFYAGNPTDQTHGLVDEVRISDVALDPSQFLFAAPSGTVTGRVALEGVPNLAAISPGAPLGTFHVSFRTPGTTTEVFGKDVTLTTTAGSAFGTFTVSGVPTGTYDVAIKGSKNLRVIAATGLTVSKGTTTTLPDALLPAGDADNNNIVDIGDFGILVNAYLGDFNVPGSGYDPTADFNFDGKNDIGDFGLLVNNFGTPGAP